MDPQYSNMDRQSPPAPSTAKHRLQSVFSHITKEQKAIPVKQVWMFAYGYVDDTGRLVCGGYVHLACPVWRVHYVENCPVCMTVNLLSRSGYTSLTFRVLGSTSAMRQCQVSDSQYLSITFLLHSHLLLTIAMQKHPRPRRTMRVLGAKSPLS